MILGFAWYYWFGAFACFVIGIGILADGIGQGWIHRLKRKKKVKPLGRHARRTDTEHITYTLSEDWKYVVAEPKVQAMTELPPVPKS